MKEWRIALAPSDARVVREGRREAFTGEASGIGAQAWRRVKPFAKVDEAVGRALSDSRRGATQSNFAFPGKCVTRPAGIACGKALNGSCGLALQFGVESLDELADMQFSSKRETHGVP